MARFGVVNVNTNRIQVLSSPDKVRTVQNAQGFINGWRVTWISGSGFLQDESFCRFPPFDLFRAARDFEHREGETLARFPVYCSQNGALISRRAASLSLR